MEDTESENEEENPTDYELTRDRTRRAIKPPNRYGFADVVHYALNIAEVGDFEPKNYDEAMECSDSQRWKLAMDDEIYSLKRNNTWSRLEVPVGKKVVRC